MALQQTARNATVLLNSIQFYKNQPAVNATKVK